MIELDDLTFLACPRCKGSMSEESRRTVLHCRRCAVWYPVRDGFPILLAEEAMSEKPRPLRR